MHTIWKRVISIILCTVIVMGTFGSITAKAESNDIIPVFINMAANKHSTDVDITSANLTKKDLQFLGVYISNYYAPFHTELGLNGSEDAEDVSSINKEDIKKALQANLYFSDSMAESLTETLIQLTRTSAMELKLVVSKEYQDGNYVEVPNMPLNYYTFLSVMLGGMKELVAQYTDNNSNDVIEGIKNNTYKYGYLAYVKNGKNTPMFDFNISGNDMTASTSSFLTCLQSAELEKGYALNFLDFTSNEIKNDATYKDILGQFTEDEIVSMSAYGTKMMVDCFGNILSVGANHQFVIIPGAVNPYTWVTVKSDGSEAGNGTGGTAYNMMNLPSLSLYHVADVGSGSNRLFENVSASDNAGNTPGSSEGSYDSDMTYTFTGTMSGSNKEIKGIGGTLKNNFINELTNILDYAGGVNLGKADVTITLVNNDLKVIGTASKLSNISGNKMQDSALNKVIKDKGQYADRAQSAKNSKDILNKSYGITEKDLVNNLNTIGQTASKMIEGGKDNSDTESGNNSVGIIRRATVNTYNIRSRLSNFTHTKDGDTNYVMSRVRGDSETSLAEGWSWNDFFMGSNYRDLVVSIENSFKSKNPLAKNYNNSDDNGSSSGDFIELYSNGDILSGGRNVALLDTMMYVDDLGAAHFDDSGNAIDPYSTFNALHYIDSDSSAKTKTNEWAQSSENMFVNTFKGTGDGKMYIYENVSDELMVGLYATYLFSSCYDAFNAETKQNTIGKIGYKMNANNLPNIGDGKLELSDEAVSDIMLTSIRDWTYYLLHPTEGFTYVSTLLKNTVNSFLITWHNDMVGTNGTGSINGTTKYRGTAGYVTTPELSDLPWTNSMLNVYNELIPFLIVVMMVIMLFSYISSVLSLQKAIIGFLIFTIAITIPPVAINEVIGTSNKISSSIYGDKFTYWALVQHESYSDAIDKAANSGSYSNYLKELYARNADAKGNQGRESVMLKWQAPKKMASLMMTSNEESMINDSGVTDLFKGFLNSTYSGESYLDDPESMYLYRSYIDIANFSRYIHRGLVANKQLKKLDLTSDITNSWDSSLVEAVGEYSTKYENDRAKGYANNNGDGSTSGDGANILRVRLPMSSGIVSDALAQRGTIDDLSLNEYVGINQNAFNFSIPMFNVGSGEGGMSYDSIKEDNTDLSKYTSEDFSGLAGYGLMSENPFYYFSWYLYESGLTEETSNKTGYKNLLLGEDNAGFFYNTKGNGEMKDFMDMRSLFTYVIPYLKQGNDLVDEWDETYGIFLYEGIPYEEGHQKEFEDKEGDSEAQKVKNKELRQKYWHNLNVARLYNVYTPWVDIMYDCSYAKPEKVNYLGDDYVIQDPINPSSYPKERPMIFSKSEMVDYGLSEKDLTKVEKLILKCEEGMMERMFKLLNYHTFNDVVLNTASAMNCAFEFNKTFSENALVGANHMIYPQEFELNDFSYDAFLRFILANSTGDSMVVEDGENFYDTVTENSSMTTVIIMIILDILAVYAIPAFKIFFVVGIFIMAILIILTSALNVDMEQRFITRFMKSFVSPLIKFLFISIGMSYIVSMFMGDGSDAVTGALNPTISLGDPVMAMLAMIFINGVVLFLYFFVIWGVWKDIRKYAKRVVNFMGELTASIGSSISKGFIKATSPAGGSLSGGSSSGVTSVTVQSIPSESKYKSRGTDDKNISRYDESKGKSNFDLKKKMSKYKNDKKGSDSKSLNIDIDSTVSSGIDKMSEDKK